MQTAARGELGENGEAPQPARPCDVAIVGMACIVPGAPDAETFWANIVDGVDSISEVPPSRWRPELHYEGEAGSDGTDGTNGSNGTNAAGRPSDTLPKSVSKWGGWIPDVGFDALAWGIPPASLASIDPAQLLALKVAAAALEDAGYAATTGAATTGPATTDAAAGDGHDTDHDQPTSRSFDRDRASLVFATGSGGAVELSAGIALRVLLRSHGAGPLPPELDAFLPQLTPDGLPGVLTSVIAGRVANRLDLGGKNLTVDSACASVLVGLDVACNELLSGSSDLVLCGGVDLHNGAQDYISFTAAGALSPRGRCHAFDVDADGMTLAEGAGCLVLKRLADAEAHGDRIYAVVKGVAGSSDGRHLGLTAPRQEGQVKAVRRAYAAAGLSPREIGLVEAHGTGTATGDRTELETMTQAFAEGGAEHGSTVLGAAKSNIGHIKCASAVASLIKAAKSAYHGVLPPTLHIHRPNEVWDRRTSPFVFLDQARPWLDERRVVGVSSFGFGGTNFHAILENHRPRDRAGAGHRDRDLACGPDSGRPHWPAELVALRATTPAELDERLARLCDRVTAALDESRAADRWRLRDLAAAENATGAGPVQLAVVATGLDDLAEKLRRARGGELTDGVYLGDGTGLPTPDRDGGTASGSPAVAFLVPGVDAVRPGMAADLLVAFPEARAVAEPSRPSVETMLPPQAFTAEDHARQSAALLETAETALTVAGSAVARILAGLGVAPVTVLGPGPLLPSTLLAAPGSHRRDVDAARSDLEREVRELAERGVRVFVEVGPGQSLTELVDRVLDGVPHLAVATDRPGDHGVPGLLHAVALLAVAGVAVDLAALQAGRDCRPHRWHDPGRPPGWIVNGHCARTATGDSLPKGLRPADQAPPVRIYDADDPALTASVSLTTPATSGLPAAPAAAAPAGDPGGLTQGDMAAVTEYLRLVHGIIAAGSDIIRGQVEPS